MKIKLSIYTKTGKTAASPFYRIIQYTEKMPHNTRYHEMIPEKIYGKVMPIYTKPIIIKILLYVYLYFRVLFQLISDYFWNPNTIILSRRFLNRNLPLPHKIIIKRIIRRGTKLIWDFDDEIIATKEITRKDFNLLSELSSRIVVASKNNLNMVNEEYRSKVRILPTTDGTMYFRYNDDILQRRLHDYDQIIRIIWVGTSVSLQYVSKICNHIERLASNIDKKVIFTVVCDQPLTYRPSNFNLINIKWDRETAKQELLKSHIGIMPLDDNQITQGKGGFKLIQYLSVGLPIVGSGVGINQEIIIPETGYSVDTLSSRKWEEAFFNLSTNKLKWQEMSSEAYNHWHLHYSFTNNLSEWNSILSVTTE